jgi:hypothetical protein
MVESMNENILTLLTGLTIKVTSNDLRNSLRRMERQPVFLSLDDTEKINYILQFADEKNLEFQESLEKKKRTKSMKYQEWKNLMLNQFETRMSEKEYLRSRPVIPKVGRTPHWGAFW